MRKTQHTTGNQCCQTVYPSGSYSSFRGYACGKPAKHQDEEGNWFCGIHSPEAKARRIAKRAQRWEEQDAVMKRRCEDERRARICVSACEGISTKALESDVIKELLVTAQTLIEALNYKGDDANEYVGHAELNLEAAIAKAKGEQT